MRTDLKVGVISLFALVVACVLFFAWHSNKPGKDVGVATPVRTASNTESRTAMSVGAPSDAPTTAPSAAVALPAPSVSAFGPSHALGADTPYISPPSPTTAPSSTSLIPPAGATGLSAPGGTNMSGGLNSSNSIHQPLSNGSTGLVPPGSTGLNGGLNSGLNTGTPSLLPPSTGPSSVGSGIGNLSGNSGNTGFGAGNTSSLTPRPSTLEIGTPSSSGSTHAGTHGIDIPGFGTSSSSVGGTGSSGGTYAIQKGDTLAVLAKKNHTTTKAILAANPGVNPNRLKVGQKIKMPEASSSAGSTSSGLGGSTIGGGSSFDTSFGGTGTTTTQPAGSHRGATTRGGKGTKATGGSSKGPQSSLAGGSYTIKKGDTLRKIAKSVYGNEKLWARIFRANRGELSSPNALKVGQTIQLPK